MGLLATLSPRRGGRDMTRPLHRPREAAGSGGEEPFDYVETVISSPPGIAARALLNALMDAFFDLPPRRVRKAKLEQPATVAVERALLKREVSPPKFEIAVEPVTNTPEDV